MARQPNDRVHMEDFGIWVLMAGLIGLGAILLVAYFDAPLLAGLGGNPTEAFLAVVYVAIFVWVFQLIFTVLSERSRARQFHDLSNLVRATTARIDVLTAEIQGLRDDMREGEEGEE
jgi:hypothetical protein